MHIAFLTPEYPDPKTGSAGGIGTSIKNLASALVNEGIMVSLFIYGQDKDEHYIENNIQVYRIKNVVVKGLSWLLTRYKVAQIINRAIAKTNISVLEVADWTGFSSWMQIDCPVVMRLHGSDTYFCHLDKRPVKWWNRLQEKTAFKHADAIIAVSHFVGRETNAIFGLNRQYEVIPNSIDTNRFFTSPNTTNKKIILYFGTLIRKKGVLDIPEVFNQVVENIPDATLLLVGGDAKDISTGNASTWELMQGLFSPQAMQQTTYLGKKPYAEMQTYIQEASVCIFPSYAEALPVSWLEAMAMGKAIVASNIGWANEMMEHDREALLCHPSQHNMFATHIIQLLQDEEKRNSLGTNARKRVVNQFDNSIIAKKNICFYSHTIQSYKNSK